MKQVSLVVFVGMLLAGPALANKGSCSDGVCVKVLGQSGKISVASVDSEDDIDKSDYRVVIDMDSLTEVDSQGNEVGKTGSTKHSFNSFASQTFAFSSVKAGDVQGVNATYFTFQSQLKDLTSTVKVEMYIFTEAGNITIADENVEVKEGNVKFSINLTNWQWCGCMKGQTQETGAFVDFNIEIKGKGSAAKAGSPDDSELYTLGGGSSLKLSKKVQIDDVWQDMASGYPKYTTKGSKQIFTFRFDKFDRSAYYDPTLDMGGRAGASSWSALLLAAALLLSKIL